ncbi:MAG: EI24 domain-containing protein [Amaricoccus sp.]
MSLVVDLARALAQLGDPRFLRVVFLALALTVVALAVVFAGFLVGLDWLLPEHVTLPWVGRVDFLDSLASWAAIGLMLLLSVFLMVPTAAAVVGFFLDGVVEAVEARHYPGLPPATPPGLGRQVADSLRFLGLVVAANLVALVIYFAVPPLAPVIFWVVNGYLLGREYFALVASRRLPPEQAAALYRQNAGRLWLAGTAMVVPMSVPLLNLVVPVIGVAVFTHQFHRLAGDARYR